MLWLVPILAALVWGGLSVLAQDGEIVGGDFEDSGVNDRWWSYDDGSILACEQGSPGYESDHALSIAFDTNAGSWPGCGVDLDTGADWSAATGLRLMLRGSEPGLVITVVLSVNDPGQTNPDTVGSTPFQADIEVSSAEWTGVELPWTAFRKAAWVGSSGMDRLALDQVSTLLLVLNESQSGAIWIDDLALSYTPPSLPPVVELPDIGDYDKFALWTGGTQLRGVNTWQRVVVTWVDGMEFMGDSYIGPPYTQEDFDRLAAMGANYVNISGPGLFTETEPYELDEAVQAYLDSLLSMIAQADMFAVISVRTGPGRSDFTFYWSGGADWGDASLLNDDIWLEQSAQDAWVEMWRAMADHYKDHPVVIGYDLMVEPDAAGQMLDIYEPSEFYPAYAGTLYDWNQLYPRIVAAIREVDQDTPILVAALGWSGVRWLPYLQPVDDPRTVYMVHQYEPQDSYTHQDYPAENTYPGEFDVTWDGVPDTVNRDWLDDFLGVIDDYKAKYGVPVAVNEYGVARWVPGAADFMRDEMALFEARGMNNAFWTFNPSWEPFQGNDMFDFTHGPDPANHTTVENDLWDVILNYWQLNTVRPSNVGQ
ncbi:MAG: CIA30 family protein [Anaerolineae bacterium]|nr:CIA30 family protein [Anaerolineae bacterium]